jgi:hypothetical protein
MDPLRAMEKIKSDMIGYYPLGEFSAAPKEPHR